MRRNALEEATLSRMGKKGQDKTYDKKEADVQAAGLWSLHAFHSNMYFA